MGNFNAFASADEHDGVLTDNVSGTNRVVVELVIMPITKQRLLNDFARELAAICNQLSLAPHVNLIPLNPTPGWPTDASPMGRVREFCAELESFGVNATIRRNRNVGLWWGMGRSRALCRT